MNKQTLRHAPFMFTLHTHLSRSLNFTHNSYMRYTCLFLHAFLTRTESQKEVKNYCLLRNASNGSNFQDGALFLHCDFVFVYHSCHVPHIINTK